MGGLRLALGIADLLAAEQLELRGRYLHDHAELHAHSSLVLSHGQDTLERPHSCCGAPAWRNNAVSQLQQQMSADFQVPSRVAIPLLVAAALFALANSAPAQTRTATLNVTINGFARLTLSSSGVSFPDSSPDLVPQVPGTPGPLAITVKARTTRELRIFACRCWQATTFAPACERYWPPTSRGLPAAPGSSPERSTARQRNRSARGSVQAFAAGLRACSFATCGPTRLEPTR